ncbi:fluoride efflux transporter CrcB [Glaciibacter psychrotolerans]|uniref:Fluoride-specific ion channel FluC n=1 Tax=Glaciibacter psychrotolerans TaxID=670054 RepID=A0A7Z0J5B9_9MICO|nr:CrcB protein [Leifsonia psychrotolerans]
MTPLVYVALALAGGAGASLRFVLDGLIRTTVQTAYPFATTLINVSGSLLLGLITGLAAQLLLPPELALILGAGFLGGYTTFSTASYETVRLIQQRRYGESLASGVGMLMLAVGAAMLGLWIASLF